jgi:hypothetical protein
MLDNNQSRSVKVGITNLPAYVARLDVAAVGDSATNCALPSISGLLIGYWSAPITMICWAIANGAMTYSVVQDIRRRIISIAQASAIATRRFLPLIGVAIVVGLLFWLGFVLLICF